MNFGDYNVYEGHLYQHLLGAYLIHIYSKLITLVYAELKQGNLYFLIY